MGEANDSEIDQTLVGATDLTMTGTGATWSSEVCVSVTTDDWGSTGGILAGTITGDAIPSYQSPINMTANFGSTTYRNVPDVSCAGNNCYIVDCDGTPDDQGGSSCAAPLWAGFFALANQQAVANGKPTIGFANPSLYTLGQGPDYTSDFHDITSGNNGSPTQFPAVTGYDLATGWGSPKGQSLIDELTGTTPVATPTGTPTQTPTFTPTSTGTKTATSTITNTPTFTATPTVTSTSTNTASVTPTSTPTHSPTNTLTPTITDTATNTATSTQTFTPTNSATNSATSTNSGTPTNSATNTATNTMTNTPTQTYTPVNTPTGTVTPTHAFTPGSTPLIYPNPVLGPGPVHLQVPLTSLSNLTVRIYTTAFRRVQEEPFSQIPPGQVINLTLEDERGNPLANGLYYLVIEAQGKRWVTKLLITR
jgi:hypothetical protein